MTSLSVSSIRWLAFAVALVFAAGSASAQDRPPRPENFRLPDPANRRKVKDRLKEREAARERREKEAREGKTDETPRAAREVKPLPEVPATQPVVAAGPNATAIAAAPPGTPNPEDAELYKCRNYPEGARIRVTLKPDTDLKDLVAWVMGYTCKSFIFGNAISGRAAKVTIIAPNEMTPGDAYRLFLVALQTMNLTIVPKGKTYEIVESQRGRELPIPVYKGGMAPAIDQIVRVVFRPEHVSVDEVTQVFNALKTATGVITPIPAANIMIITDYGSSISRMMDVVKEVDVPTSAEKIYIINLKSADAQEMATKLGEIFGIGRGTGGNTAAPAAQRPRPNQPGQPGQPPPAQPAQPAAPGGPRREAGGSTTPSKIIPDQRTNSLIVIASDRAYARILALVRRLDPLEINEGETGSIHVYYLSNADAEALAGTLNALITGQVRTTTPRQGQGGQQRPGQPAQPAAQPGAAAVAGGATAAFEGQIKITHDKPTNSLVVISSVKDYLSLREVIKKLDLPRRQVFVEATILELSVDKTRKIGFSYHAGETFQLKDANDTIVFGGVEAKSLSSLATSPATLDGLIGGVIGPQIPGISIPSIGVLFQLVQNTNDVNVLSSPNILTTDNEEAEISVGQNIPYLSTSLGSAGALSALAGNPNAAAANPLLGLGGLGQSIQRQDLALTLKITPHVNDSDYVRLEIEQDIKDIVSVDFGGNGPSWSNRKVKTMIVVKDQQPVVIGGLISEKMTLTETKVPLLGDIPLLGYLFKYQQRNRQKTNLIIFLTPYIIKDQSDVQRIFEQKVREKREFIDAYTAFEGREWEPNVDWKRKRGLIAEINKAVQQADDDERLQHEIELQRVKRRAEEGPVERSPDLQPGHEEEEPHIEEIPQQPVPPPPPPEQ